MKTHPSVLKVVLSAILLLNLAGCGAVKMKIFGAAAELPSVTPPVSGGAMLQLGLTLSQTLGKNKYLDFKEQDLDGASPIIDSSNRMHHLGTDGIYILDSTGVLSQKIALDTTTYADWLTKGRFARSAAGDYYIVNQPPHSTSGGGILKVSANGATKTIFSVASAQSLACGAYDIKIFTRSDNSEEIHISRYTCAGTPTGIDVYKLDGTYLRSYAMSTTAPIIYLTQSLTTKEIYTSNGMDNVLMHFDESGSDLGDITVTAVKQITGISFDTSGKFYLLDEGDQGIVADPRTGLNVYDVSTVPFTLLNQIRASTHHPFRLLQRLSMSPDGSRVDFFSADTKLRERYSFSAGTYQFSEYIGSMGIQNNEFFVQSSTPCAAIASDSSGNIYIDDVGNRRVKVYSSSLTFLRTFATDNPNITLWGSHSLALSSTGKVVTTGLKYDSSTNQSDIIIQTFSAAGVPQSTNTLSGISGAPTYIGIDNQDRVWFDNGTTNIFSVSLSGVAQTSLDYSNAQTTFGIPAAFYFRVIGDSIYLLNGSNYHLMKSDLTGATTEIFGTDGLSESNSLAILSSTLQVNAAGKLYGLAMTTTGGYQYVVLDPAQGYRATSIVNSPNLPTGQFLWNSSGLISLTLQNQLILQLVQ